MGGLGGEGKGRREYWEGKVRVDGRIGIWEGKLRVDERIGRGR